MKKEAVIDSIMKKRIFSLCCVLGLGTTTLFAQSDIVSSGGNASGTGGSISYTVGQTYFNYISSSSFNMLNGLQQPYEISVVGVETPEDIKLNAVVFPIPVLDVLNLSIPDKPQKELKYIMYNLNGEQISQGKVESNLTEVSTASLCGGIYILSVYESNKVLKTFKILKQY